jgi:autotransporter-associated beta strand protein
MKPKASLRSFLAVSGSVLLLATQAQANYYWDSNGNAAGLGNTAGTWGAAASPGWGGLTGGDSRSILNGTRNTANTTIGNHTVYFGTMDLALGSTASTIGITGAGVSVSQIVFGLGQGSQGVTLSGGGGNITLTNSRTIVANNSGTNTIGAVLNGTLGLVYGGSGTTQLTGSNGFTGGVTVTNGGTLQIGDGTSGSIQSQNLTFHSGGGVFNVRAANSGSTQAMGTLTFANTGTTSGEGTLQSTYGSSGNAALSFTSLAARQAGATGNFVVTGGSNGSTNKIVLSGASTGFLDKGLYFGGSSYAAYDAGGFVRGLIYDGLTPDANTEVTNTITASRHVRLTSSPAARAGDTLLSLKLDGGGVDYTMNSGSLTVPAILKSGGGALSTISGGTSLTTASNAELVIRTDKSSDLLTISSLVTGFSGGLTKTGEGTLTLSNSANAYTGATRINAGILAVGGGDAIKNDQAVILANSAGASLQLNANETILNVTGGGLSGGNVNVQGNTLTLSSTGNYTFSGRFTGSSSGGVIKQGAGTLTLSNKNTFAGTFTLEGGAVEFQYGNDGTGAIIPLSSGGAFNMANGTTLRFNPQTNLAWGTFGNALQAANGGSPAYPYGWTFDNDINIISGTANVRVTGNENTIRFTGDVTGSTSGSQTLAIYSGGIAVGSGDREANTFAGTIQNGSGGTLGVNVDFAGASSTAQAAFVNLSGQNTFTGPLVVTNSKGLVAGATTGGYVGIGGEMYASTSTFVTGNGYLGGGNYTNTISLATGTTLVYLSSANQTLGGEISGAGALRVEAPTNGILTLSTDNTYTGATTVNSGSLIINGSTSTTSIVSVASGATLGGIGTIGGDTTISGTLSPGSSPGTLTFTNDLTLNNGAIYAFEGGDLTAVGQTLGLNDNWTLALGTGFQDGGQVLLFTYGTLAASPDLVPTFDITNLGFTPSGSLSLTDDTLGNIYLNGVSVIPEPRAALLGGLGVLMLLRRRRA